MSPNQLSAELRRMAAAIDRANKPTASLVAEDLRKLLVAVEEAIQATPQETPVVPSEPAALTPEQAAEAIQTIANKLAASKNPNPELLVSDLKSVISRL